jgi:uncharacterized membrane protein
MNAVCGNTMFRNQPKIDIKPSPTDRKIILIGWLLVVLNFIIVFAFHFQLPDTVPTHFNLRGEADDFGSKSTLWLLPSISLLTYFLMSTIIIKMKPWNYNYPTKVTEKNAPRLYAMTIQMMARLNLGIVLLFLIISIEIILKASQYDGIRLGWTFIPLTVLIIIFPFWYIFKMFKLPKE